jgi:hypothetical protein
MFKCRPLPPSPKCSAFFLPPLPSESLPPGKSPVPSSAPPASPATSSPQEALLVLHSSKTTGRPQPTSSSHFHTFSLCPRLSPHAVYVPLARDSGAHRPTFIPSYVALVPHARHSRCLAPLGSHFHTFKPSYRGLRPPHSSFIIQNSALNTVRCGGLTPHLASQASFRLGYSFPQRFFLGSLAFANHKKSV